MSKSYAAILVLPLLAAASQAQQIPALVALERVGKLHGQQFIERIVEMKGRYGQPQPDEWELIVHDKSTPYLLREFWVGDTRATNEGVNYDYYPDKSPAGFIRLRDAKLDSTAAFKILDREAEKAKIGFDSVHYHLRCREFSDEPVWVLSAVNKARYLVGKVAISARTGEVFRTVWLRRTPKSRIPAIEDSALTKPPRWHDDPGTINPEPRREPDPLGVKPDPLLEEPEPGPLPAKPDPLLDEPRPVPDPLLDQPKPE